MTNSFHVLEAHETIAGHVCNANCRSGPNEPLIITTTAAEVEAETEQLRAERDAAQARFEASATLAADRGCQISALREAHAPFVAIGQRVATEGDGPWFEAAMDDLQPGAFEALAVAAAGTEGEKRPVEGTWFWALEQMKAGKRVTRPGWKESGTGFLVKGRENQGIYCLADFTHNSACIPYHPFVEDFEASDWQLVSPDAPEETD